MNTQFLVTDMGLTLNDRMLMPGSTLIIKSAPHPSWLDCGHVVGQVTERRLEVASPAPKETEILTPWEDDSACLLGSSIIASEVVISGNPVRLGDIVSAAYAASGLTAVEWNGLPETDREAILAAQVSKMQESSIKTSSDLDDVRAQYEQVTGKKPHHKAKAETLLAEIAQHG